ncbi:putative protein C17G6,02c [Schizosaccharomyces pombe 972h-] [Rhizoctonia solani]|uniref:Uncharacterized protein n=1 Tax=Rhizoctonia solani TaxID=456999 RepID=A0A0K6G0D9_9AGAM|nr:putative protein C17G6,02c [Schizosaccharomyces pombe 972h-] [Rhizoctonia solani]
MSSFLLLLVQVSFVLAQNDETKERPLAYIPNKIAAIVAGSIYMFTAGASALWLFRHWGRYMLAIIIGSACYAAGLYLRIVYANDPDNVMKYATMNLIILLSPCAFIAGVYMLLSCLAIHLDATDLLLVPHRLLTKVFVISDVVTFLAQAAGGGMTAGDNANMQNVGKKIFLGGLIAQLISFLGYTVVFGVFVWRMRTQRNDDWSSRPHGILRHWLALAAAMALSCQNIIVRSVFRVAENAQGRHGVLAGNEQYFYMMDCAVLWVAVSVFLVIWPPRYLTGYKPAGTGRELESEVKLIAPERYEMPHYSGRI